MSGHAFAREQVPRVDPVGALLHLARRARHAASATELGFIVVNETHALAPYRQAALWFAEGGVIALSGVVSPEANAPFVQWLDRVAIQLARRKTVEATPITPDALLPTDAAEWDEWLPANAIWLPLPDSRSGATENRDGGLILAREQPWEAPELSLLMEWTDIWRHAARAQYQPKRGATLMRWLQRPRVVEQKKQSPRDRLLNVWRSPLKRYGVLALLCAFIPVRLSVLVPGELMPAQPAAIRAPLEGTVDRFFVTPNQSVKAGDPLFQLDLTTLTSKLNVARQELATAQAEYRQAAQQAVFDAKSKSQLALLQGRIAEHDTEVAYLDTQLVRARVTAPRSGIVLVDDPTEWIGRPVTIGERVMTVADEHDVEVEAWLAPADAIDLAKDAPVTLYLNASPLHPVRATLRYVAHEATARPDGSFAYRLRATLNTQEVRPRVGLKGTARAAGHYVPLVYWLTRRPLAALRPWLGW